MNKVILMGHLVTDPELKTTPSGVSVTSFRIAVDRKYVKQGEERQTDFINIVCWRQRAEFVCKYFVKGQLIALDGSIQTRQYQDKNGNNRTAVEVVADNVYFTGDKRGVMHSADVKPPSQEDTPAYSANKILSELAEPADFEEIALLTDDDLPF